MPDTPNRKLAAIMFSDIAGYTAMMQQDESAGIRTVNRFRELLHTYVEQFNGKILQFYGDGSLCIFQSSIEALKCARMIQENSQEPIKVPLRIGLHLGDIVFSDDTIYGDGVNIASRVESLGIPGAILFSERMVYDVKSHPDLQSVSLGPFHFKNIDEPMEVFALSNEGLAVPKREEMSGKLKEDYGDKSNIFFEPQAASESGIYVNDILIDTICEKLAAYNQDLDNELNRDELDIPSIKREIVDCFPLPIGEQLRKLFTRSKNPDAPDEMERFTQNRFIQIINTYRCTAQFIAYIMLSQLWDEKHHKPNMSINEPLKNQILQLFSLTHKTYRLYDYVQLVRVITQLFDSFSITYFITELKNITLGANVNLQLNKAYTFFQDWLVNIDHTPIEESQIEELCIAAEEHLGVILNEFAFLIQYKLVTIKNIEIIKQRHLKAKYRHRQIQLNKALTIASTGISEVGMELDNFTDNKCVLFFKLNQNEVETYLSLSPFIIDQNALNKDSSSKLYAFCYQERQNYHFQFLNNLKDRTLMVSDTNYPQIKSDFQKFKLTVLDVASSESSDSGISRKPTSRFLKKR